MCVSRLMISGKEKDQGATITPPDDSRENGYCHRRFLQASLNKFDAAILAGEIGDVSCEHKFLTSVPFSAARRSSESTYGCSDDLGGASAS
jgi:hypothetical protein